MARTLHGLTVGGKPPEYFVWSEMIRRCHNQKHPRYADYGGRGVHVCDAWRGNFAAFIEHVGWRPSPELTLDRIDNNRGYEPGNIRWVTYSEQNKNRRNVILVTDDGETSCLKDYCRKIGRPYKLTLERIRKYGWSIERAVDPTPGKRARKNF